MKFSLLSVVMLGTGGILLYSGIKAYDPRDVLKWGLGGKKPETFLTPSGGMEVVRPPSENPDPGQRYPGDVGLPDPSTDGRVDT